MKITLTIALLLSFGVRAACTTDTDCFKQAMKDVNQGIKYKCLPEAAKALESLENDILNYNLEELKTCLIRAKEASKFKASVARLKKKLASVK